MNIQTEILWEYRNISDSKKYTCWTDKNNMLGKQNSSINYEFGIRKWCDRTGNFWNTVKWFRTWLTIAVTDWQTEPISYFAFAGISEKISIVDWI